MSAEPALSKFAITLDPVDRDGVKQFRRIAEYLVGNLALPNKNELLERLTTGIAMLELAGITGEAAFRFRSELVAASEAIDAAVRTQQAENLQYPKSVSR